MLADAVVSVAFMIVVILLVANSTEAMTLSILGFLSLGIGMTFSTIFDLSSMGDWEWIFQAIWIFLAINAFIKIAVNPKDMFDAAYTKVRRKKSTNPAMRR